MTSPTKLMWFVYITLWIILLHLLIYYTCNCDILQTQNSYTHLLICIFTHVYDEIYTTCGLQEKRE